MVVGGDWRMATLVMVLPEYRSDVSGMYAVYPHRRQLPLAVSALIDFVATKVEAGACSNPAHRRP